MTVRSFFLRKVVHSCPQVFKGLMETPAMGSSLARGKYATLWPWVCICTCQAGKLSPKRLKRWIWFSYVFILQAKCGDAVAVRKDLDFAIYILPGLGVFEYLAEIIGAQWAKVSSKDMQKIQMTQDPSVAKTGTAGCASFKCTSPGFPQNQPLLRGYAGCTDRLPVLQQ